MKTYMDLQLEYKQLRSLLFDYMKSTDDIRLIHKFSNEIANLDYKITRISEMLLFDINEVVKISYITIEIKLQKHHTISRNKAIYH